ncbi:MAG: adenylate/guanylate cyclase domain-containing protein [Bradyrhizobium sp.]
MKRKIAAIFAADIAGYSRLVAEDEEETLRRLASYRLVIDDFIAKGGGRIFNTAGDAVLAEFPSAVEAVRCAIDIQESLRTRNMAYPPSRQMAFRIGITIGDVVERDGDLLGDGVNIAARLEGLAEVGGICVSRAVHEQVANKLSVQFADIGEQEVKNIPNPVHAYMVAMRREDGTLAKPQVKKPAKAQAAPNWMWPVAVTVVSLAAIGVGGFLYFTKLELAPNATPTPMASSPSSPSPLPQPSASSASAPTPTKVASSPTPTAQPSLPSPTQKGEKLAPETMPFVGNRTRTALASEYVPAADFKAIATTINGINAYVVGQPSEEAARTTALDQCQKRADAGNVPRKCEIYAVGNVVVYAHGRPPVPPFPWIRHDTSIERPFSADEMPMIRDQGRTRLENSYLTGRKTKAIAISPSGQFFFSTGNENVDEATRRNLEACGAVAGVPCLVIALDDAFVVPVPRTMKVTGFFKPGDARMIAADARDQVFAKLADASGWNAVAVGAAGRPGLSLKAASEQNAVNEALANCVKSDSDCHVIAIGPFAVGPN